MAIVELTHSRLAAESCVAEGSDLEGRLSIHDASRLEWSVGIPLPERTPRTYSIDVEMEIPSNAFVRHVPWDQLQQFTRLDGSDSIAVDSAIVDIDALRRGAVAVANRMAKASDGFARHCLGAASLFRHAKDLNLEEALTTWLDTALAIAEDARSRLATRRSGDTMELARERVLVDEFVSVRLFEMLAHAERGLDVLKGSHSRHSDEYGAVVAKIELRIADALERETERRTAQGFVCPDPQSPAELERYLERASRLKKHFQEVLFLQPEVYEVAARLHHWVAGFVALVASTWAFVWQLTLMNRGPSATKVGSGLVAVAMVAGLIYATKDRLKEAGRNWISGHVRRLYAQRVTRFRTAAKPFGPGGGAVLGSPSRRGSTKLPRRVVVTARESFDQLVEHLPDPLNPDCGATVPQTTLRYTHKGTILPLPELFASGVHRVKHVFRYDLSPLFPRLDDPVKNVPVLDRATRRMCLTAAPRSYRIPMRVQVRSGDQVWEDSVTVVLHKGGLDRLERASAELEL
jgi:hypothetical protein